MRVPAILVVEDNAAYARLTELLLEEALPGGVEVRRSSTLAAALDALAQHPADCVLLDLGLSDARDLEAPRAIRATGTPMVVLSGREDGGLAAAVLALGASAFVPKGREREELPGALAAALAESS